MKTTKNKLMINIIIAAKLLLKIPVKAVRLQNAWGLQVEISEGVNLVAPIVGAAALISSSKMTSKISVMKNRLEKVKEVLEGFGLSNCFVLPEMVAFVIVGGDINELKNVIKKKLAAGYMLSSTCC